MGLATDGDLLVTHAGLTAGLWERLGSPGDVRDVLPLLNGSRESVPEALWGTGRLL
ncbi:hypothetical protein ACI8AK_02470 [Geodermatophilus sp. SYSU D00867]